MGPCTTNDVEQSKMWLKSETKYITLKLSKFLTFLNFLKIFENFFEVLLTNCALHLPLKSFKNSTNFTYLPTCSVRTVFFQFFKKF